MVFKPGMAAQSRSNKIPAQKHFAGYLGVARLVGADEGHVTKTVKVESDDGE